MIRKFIPFLASATPEQIAGLVGKWLTKPAGIGGGPWNDAGWLLRIAEARGANGHTTVLMLQPELEEDAETGEDGVPPLGEAFRAVASDIFRNSYLLDGREEGETLRQMLETQRRRRGDIEDRYRGERQLEEAIQKVELARLLTGETIRFRTPNLPPECPPMVGLVAPAIIAQMIVGRCYSLPGEAVVLQDEDMTLEEDLPARARLIEILTALGLGASTPLVVARVHAGICQVRFANGERPALDNVALVLEGIGGFDTAGTALMEWSSNMFRPAEWR